MTDDDVKAMLHRHAADVTPSPDAWEQIVARIEADERPAAALRRHPFRVAGGAVAVAAAVAAFVVAQVVPGNPTTQTADETTTSLTTPAFVPPDFPHVFPEPTMSAAPAADPIEAAKRYLQARTGVAPGEPRVVNESADGMQLRFDTGPVFSELFLRASGGGWWVDSAASDLLQITPSYIGGVISGGGGVEADGAVTFRYRGGDGEPVVVDDPIGVERLQLLEFEQPMAGEAYVVVGAVLAMDDGTFAVSETWVANPESGAVEPDGEGVDTYRGVWPAYTGEELAGYEEQARTGSRPDLEDPQAVAGQFLGEVFFPRDTSEVSYQTEPFQQGDSLSGEVPFTTTEGVEGIVAVRRHSADARVWYVVYAATQPPAFDTIVDDGGITVTPADGVTLTLAEAQPVPGGDLVTGEPADGRTRFEGVTDAIVKLRGTDAEGRTVIAFLRTAAAD